MTADGNRTLTAPRPELEPGDRFPSFFLPDSTGAVRSFVERARGAGLAVFLDPDAALLAAMRETAADYRAAELECLALDQEAHGDPDVAMLADGAGKIRASLRRMSGHAEPGPLAFLLDRNQRVVAVEGGARPPALTLAPTLAHWALERWRQEPARAPMQQIGEIAPVLVVPNVLSRGECRALIARWSEHGHAEGTVTSLVKGEQVNRVYEELKKRRDHKIAEPEIEKPLLALIGRKIAPELDKAFHYRRFRFDRPNVVCYDAERGDHFRRHRDNQTPATADRQFALTINLNSEEYEGGELTFPEYGQARHKPPTGGAILFSCSLLHEALPVTRGQRFALLSFLRDASGPAAGGTSLPRIGG
jgi:predicted 2-oxoglutarate/Fe(II)-dependent dioxygenase YbiX